MDDNPLKELLVDSEEVELEKIVSALKKFIHIDSKTSRIVLKPSFNDLTSKKKVIVYLLGKKSAFILEVANEEAVKPKDIPDEIGVPGGTVRPKLKELKDKRIITYSENKTYYIASYQVISAINELQG